jgi:hypothetical protein
MSTKNKKPEGPKDQRKKLVHKITNSLLKAAEINKYFEGEGFMNILILATKLQDSNPDLDEIFVRLVRAENKLLVYEKFFSEMIDIQGGILSIELTPSNAGRLTNKQALDIVRKAYFDYYHEHKKFPSTAKLSEIASAELSKITGEPAAKANGTNLINESTIKGYKKKFINPLDNI